MGPGEGSAGKLGSASGIGGLASFASIGSLALDAGSSIIKGFGEKSTQDYLAARDERNAEIGRIKADQTDAQMREDLNTTLANIDVIRSAANADPLSPTGLAITANEQRIGDRARTTRVASILQQADEDEASADYRRYAGNIGLLGGIAGAGGKLLKGFGKIGA